MLVRLALLLLAVTAFAAEEAVPTHLKIKASFTRPGKDGKPEVYAEPTVITVDGKEATIRVGSAEAGVVFRVTPKVNKDGSLALTMNSEASGASVAGVQSPADRPAKLQTALPLFHGVLPKDKLFSIEDATGARRWLPLGRKVDGWTLRAYDEKREALTLSRLGQSVELILHKAVVGEVTPSLRRDYGPAPLMVMPGRSFTLGGADGQPVTLEIEVLDVTK